MGYSRAGFEVVGVDIAPQPRYPFEFVLADALEYVDAHGHEFDAVHASPPCQGYSRIANLASRTELCAAYPKLIEKTRQVLASLGRLYVIENVPEAPLLNPVILCGYSFGLRVFRHRAFESNVLLMAPSHIRHRESVKAHGAGHKLAVYTKDTARMATVAGHMFSRAVGRNAMGIDWMTCAELAEAIPPIYTEWIGAQLLRALEIHQ